MNLALMVTMRILQEGDKKVVGEKYCRIVLPIMWYNDRSVQTYVTIYTPKIIVRKTEYYQFHLLY